MCVDFCINMDEKRREDRIMRACSRGKFDRSAMLWYDIYQRFISKRIQRTRSSSSIDTRKKSSADSIFSHLRSHWSNADSRLENKSTERLKFIGFACSVVARIVQCILILLFDPITTWFDLESVKTIIDCFLLIFHRRAKRYRKEGNVIDRKQRSNDIIWSPFQIYSRKRCPKNESSDRPWPEKLSIPRWQTNTKGRRRRSSRESVSRGHLYVSIVSR